MMKEPTRLIHEDPGFARLVAASSAEEPSSEQLDKALALATDAAVSSRWSLAWRAGLGARIAIGFAVVGMAIVGIAELRGEQSPSELGVAPVAVAASLPTASPLAPTVEVAAPTVSVNDLADVPSATVSARRRVATPSSPSHASADDGPFEGAHAQRGAEPGVDRGTFREELALVSAARGALETGDVAACMRAVARYDERFHAGIFAHEIEVLRIEAIAASGDRAQARSRAEKFLAANAKSPYAERVGSLIDRTTN